MVRNESWQVGFEVYRPSWGEHFEYVSFGTEQDAVDGAEQAMWNYGVEHPTHEVTGRWFITGSVQLHPLNQPTS